MKKTLALVLALVLTLVLVPFNALAGGATVYAEINYVNGNGESQEPQNCKQLFAEDGNTLARGWYFVSSNVTFNSKLNISGDVNLILCDGYTLAVKGIYIPESSKLTIWAQSTGENQGAIVSTPESGPGIGGGNDAMGGDLVINGGKITAKGAEYAAGIGAGDAYAKATGYSSITINGGDITATGGDSGAGIGGGCFSYSNGPITINGGKVVAIGGEFAAGIGGGEDRTSPKIVISGGNVYAKATFEAAGIGGGDEGGGGDITITGGTVEARGSSGAGIGGGKQGRGGTVNISGGTVTAEGWQGAGIGGGRFRDGGVINISGGTVTATGTFSAAGIGGGWGGAGGTITISGGDVKAIAKKTYGADEGTGAGIGGGTEAYGGTIQITGGKVEAHTEAPNSHAIGCGEYKENNSQVLTIGDELCVYAGNDGTNWENGKPFSTLLRAEACKYRTNCLIETCEHPDAHYRNITEETHQRGCDYCLKSFGSEKHNFGSETSTDVVTCKDCGYSSSNCCTVTFIPVGAHGTMPTLYVERGGTVTLPDNGFDVPENRVFGGWSRVVMDQNNFTYVMKVYPAYSTIENVNENLTLHARWLSTVTIGTQDKEVTYSADGVTVPVGEMFTIPAGTGKATYDVDNGAGRYNAKTGKLTVLECGTFTVMVDTAETDTHVAASASATLTVKKADPTAEPPAPTATYGQTLGDVALTNPEGNTDGAWTWVDDASTSIGDAGEHTFKANFTPKDTANYNPVSNVGVKVSVGKAANPATISDTATVKKSGNTVDLADNVALNGATGDVSYVINGEDKGCSLSGSVLTSGNTTGTVTVNVTVAADSNYETLAGASITVTITGKDTQTIAADDVTVTYGDTGKKIEASTTGDGELSYAIKSGDAVNVDSTTGALTILKAGTATITVTAAETDTYAKATKDVNVTVSAKQIQTITASDVTATYGDTDKKVSATTNGNGAISYAVKDGFADYIDVDATSGALAIKKVPADGKACVVVTAAETPTYAQATRDVTVTIKKANAVPATVTANSRTYDGTEQPLITVDNLTLVGGEMQYTLGNATEATQPYTTSIPTGTEAGTYYVWYKVVGDENHKDTDPAPLAVTISPADKATLNKAIADAEAYYDTIKDKAEYAEVAAALKKAIDDAKTVAANPNADESAVAQAIKDANGALDKAKAEVAAIDKQAADEAAAQGVIEAIDKLPNPAGTGDKAAVEAARKAYEALSDEQKKLVPEDAVKKLTDAEAQVKAAEADEAAAQAVIDVIKALPAEAGVKDKEAVEAARKAYDALSDEQKKLVPEDAVKKLAAAEEQVKAAEADEAAAQAVIDAIKALPAEAGVDDKAAVEAARAAYDALTEDQKKLVPEDVVKKLTDAEEQVQAAEEAAETISIKKCKITVKNRTYTGKAVRKPVVTVMYGKVKLKEGRDYTLTYNKKAKQIGTYKLIVEGKGNYKGSRQLTFKIVPKGTAFTKLTGGKKEITLKWKQRKNIRGYQIQYSLKKNFSGSRKVTVKAGTLTRTIKKLKAGKKYYVRIRTYAKVKGKVYYSAWSKAKTVKTVSAKGNAGQADEDESPESGEDLTLPGIDIGIDDGMVDGIGMDGEIELTME